MRRPWPWLMLFACSHAAGPSTAARPTPEGPAAVSMPPSSPPPAPPPDPRYYTAEKVPDPLSCTDDKECLSDSIVDPGTGCCPVSGEPMPQTWVWHAWVIEHRLSPDCRAARCTPVAVPADLPRACLLEARCELGRCRNTCGAGDAGVR